MATRGWEQPVRRDPEIRGGVGRLPTPLSWAIAPALTKPDSLQEAASAAGPEPPKRKWGLAGEGTAGEGTAASGAESPPPKARPLPVACPVSSSGTESSSGAAKALPLPVACPASSSGAASSSGPAAKTRPPPARPPPTAEAASSSGAKATAELAAQARPPPTAKAASSSADSSWAEGGRSPLGREKSLEMLGHWCLCVFCFTPVTLMFGANLFPVFTWGSTKGARCNGRCRATVARLVARGGQGGFPAGCHAGFHVGARPNQRPNLIRARNPMR